ncbi:MAG: hypothetical protein WCK37_00100 [Candidatus Falkowbacteria bacterium]
MAPKKVERTECIVYSRVNGWLAPTHAFNKGRAAEWKDRKFFKVNCNCNSNC